MAFYPRLNLNIEVYDTEGCDWAQAKYLVHGLHDCLWTDSIDVALEFLRDSLENQ